MQIIVFRSIETFSRTVWYHAIVLSQRRPLWIKEIGDHLHLYPPLNDIEIVHGKNGSTSNGESKNNTKQSGSNIYESIQIISNE